MRGNHIALRHVGLESPTFGTLSLILAFSPVADSPKCWSFHRPVPALLQFKNSARRLPDVQNLQLLVGLIDIDLPAFRNCLGTVR